MYDERLRSERALIHGVQHFRAIHPRRDKVNLQSTSLKSQLGTSYVFTYCTVHIEHSQVQKADCFKRFFEDHRLLKNEAMLRAI